MLDLNSKEFNTGSSIFNNGAAGKVDNNTITVEKKQPSETGNTPDYRLIVTDEAGNKLNAGFYYPTPKEGASAEDVKKYVNREVGRVLHVAKAVLGDDYEFPAVKGAKEAFDVLFKLIKDNAGDQKFSVFVTYGTKVRPSKFLGLRYFTFIEPTDLPAGKSSRLKIAAADQMERLQEDAPTSGSSTTESGTDSDGEWEF
jgi:hypothetical protein